MSNFVNKPCKYCPFRNDVTPYLHPQRAEEIAYAAENPYSDFICHATIEYDGDEDYQGRPMGNFTKSKTCAGFLTLRCQNGDESDIPKGFEPAWQICYTDAYEMITAYEEEWEKNKI